MPASADGPDPRSSENTNGESDFEGDSPTKPGAPATDQADEGDEAADGHGARAVDAE